MTKNFSKSFLDRIPAFGSLRGYTLKNLGQDAIAGITVATVAIPQAMAYALIAGIEPQYGLYTAIVITLVAAFFDSSRQLVNGPTNAISIAVFSAVAVLPEAERLPAAALLALLAGSVQLLITFFRLGDLTRYVSHGVIIGFTLGAGVLIVLGQVKNLAGLNVQVDPHDHFLVRFWETIRDGRIHPPTLAIGIGTIVLILALRQIKRRLHRRSRFLIPEFLLAVALAALAVWWFGLDSLPVGQGVRVVGTIPQALPGFQPPALRWDRISGMWDSALAISILGLLEALAMAKAIAAKTKQKLDINQQCFSEGIANFTGSFFQCFPGSGSLTRSIINKQAGAVSQWAAIVSALTVAAVVLLLAKFAQHIPYAALAGILTVSAWRLVDRKQLLYHLRTTRFDAGIVLVTAFSAVFISVEFCILIGVFLSFVLYIPRAARLHLTELTVTAQRVIRERGNEDAPCGKMLLYNLEGELFFGSAPQLESFFEVIRRRASGDIRVIVLRCRNARNPDAVCLAHLGDFVSEMTQRGITVLVCGVHPQLGRILHNSGLEARIGVENIFFEKPAPMSSTLEAVRHAYELLNGDYCVTCPLKGEGGKEEAWYYMI